MEPRVVSSIPMSRRTEHIQFEAAAAEAELIRACTKAFIDAVVGGAHDTLSVFSMRFLSDHEEVAKMRLISNIEQVLTELSMSTCGALGLSVRKFAAFRRLRPAPRTEEVNPTAPRRVRRFAPGQR